MILFYIFTLVSHIPKDTNTGVVESESQIPKA